MPQIGEIEARLKNLRSIEHLVRSMKAMAAIRWRRARHRLGQAQTYAAEVERQLNIAIQYPSSLVVPSARVGPSSGAVGLVVITSDRGLCGAFNLSLVGFVSDFIARQQDLDHRVKIIALGGYGERFFDRTRHEVIYAHPLPLIRALSFMETKEIYERIQDLYQEGEFDQLYLIYNSFVSFGRYQRVEIRLLPPHLTIRPQAEVAVAHIIGSNPAELQRYLLAEYLAVQVHLALVESMVSEQAARLQTMESALTNMQDRIDGLVLEHNIARQESITQEVLEVSAGAEALGLGGSWR